MVEYKNPWYSGTRDLYGPSSYTTDVSPKEYRGFLIYQRIPGSWEVVKNGVCLTQRAGFSGAVSAIDNMLDNPEDLWAVRMAGYMHQHGTCND